MKCPYAVDRVVTTKTKIEYNDEDQEQGSTVTTYNKAYFAKCQESDCGAYQNGKCCYKGDI
jgi:hypothetical protein